MSYLGTPVKKETTMILVTISQILAMCHSKQIGVMIGESGTA